MLSGVVIAHGRTEMALVRTRIIGLAVWAAVLAIALFGIPLAVGVLEYALAPERSELKRIANEIAIANSHASTPVVSQVLRCHVAAAIGG